MTKLCLSKLSMSTAENLKFLNTMGSNPNRTFIFKDLIFLGILSTTTTLLSTKITTVDEY